MCPRRDTASTQSLNEQAEIVALEILAFLAEDERRLSRFLALTGLDPHDLPALADKPETKLAVVEHVLGDESLLLMFASRCGRPPSSMSEAALILRGSNRLVGG